jgi:chromate reductase, NAD(P)H dehydrogenase (quinone)
MSYTIISGTNRQGSRTKQVALIYKAMLQQAGLEAHLLCLAENNILNNPELINQLQQQVLNNTQKYIIIIPEYNGSMPGVFKYLIDTVDIKKVWWHKKAMLTGVADGRAGNLRGLDHLTNIFNYIKVAVLPNKIPLSKISTELSAEGELTQAATIQSIQQQIQEFINF